MIPGTIEHAINQARHALDVLAADVRLSDTQLRQRTLTVHVRNSMDTVDWVISYDAATCDHGELYDA